MAAYDSTCPGRRFQLAAIIALMVAAFAFPARAQDAATWIGPVTAHLVGGHDLSVPCGNLILFGDSYSDQEARTDWRPQTASIVSGTPGSGYHADYFHDDQALWSVDADAATSVPTGCVVIGGVMYAHYMEACSNQLHDFCVVRSGIVASRDGGYTWTKTPIFEGDTYFGQAALARVGDWVYLFGSEGGRTGPAYLARVPVDAVLDASQYRFWYGSGFVHDLAAAQPVIWDTVGEASLCFNTAIGQWLLAYMSPSAVPPEGAVILRTSPALEGPWSGPTVLIDWNAEYHGTYAPRLIPGSCEGRDVYMLVSHNEPDPLIISRYNVYLWRYTLP